MKTKAGTINKRTRYGKWLLGWLSGGGWYGPWTVECAWKNATQDGKPDGCSWEAYGHIMAREQKRGRALARKEDAEYIEGLRERAEKEVVA